MSWVCMSCINIKHIQNTSFRKIVKNYLAPKGAMDKRFLEASITRSTITSGVKLPILRSFFDKHHFCTIYCICLTELVII